MKTIKWELPFKNMHYLNSLTENLADNPHIILITGVQTEEGDIDRCNIILRQSEENMDNVILNIGTIIGKHEAMYQMDMERREAFAEFFINIFSNIAERAIKEEIADAEEQNQEGAPKGEDYVAPEDKEISDEEMEKEIPPLEVDKPGIKEIVEKKELVEEIVETTEEAAKEEEEKVEIVIKEIVEIAPKVSRVKDSRFVAKLRVILNNFKK